MTQTSNQKEGRRTTVLIVPLTKKRYYKGRDHGIKQSKILSLTLSVDSKEISLLRKKTRLASSQGNLVTL